MVLCSNDLVEILGAKNRPEGGLGQELGAVMSVLHVGHTHSGVADPVVHHRVHRHRHAILRQNLQQPGEIFFSYEDDDLMELGKRRGEIVS